MRAVSNELVGVLYIVMSGAVVLVVAFVVVFPGDVAVAVAAAVAVIAASDE